VLRTGERLPASPFTARHPARRVRLAFIRFTGLADCLDGRCVPKSCH
jgi:hypothetical protein